MYDVLITAAEKDFNKLPYVIESIEKNIDGFAKIYVVTPVKVPKPLQGITYALDDEVLDFDYSKFKGNIAKRKGWYAQQFIKLFQSITSNDYLVIDSDVYITKKLSVVKEGKPHFFLGKDQLHLPYFEFIRLALEIDRVCAYSFINEIMYFKRDLIKQMIAPYSIYGFFEFATKILNAMNHETSSFSEYETYGNFIVKEFPGLYGFTQLETASVALKRTWSDEEIKTFIKKYEGSKYDKISMHSWI